MASYEDLRNVIEHIAAQSGDPDGWQQGLTSQQIRDVNGWLASDGVGFKGYRDPETGVVYEDRSGTNTSVLPAVPDEALNKIRQAHWELFDPETHAPVSPGPQGESNPVTAAGPRSTPGTQTQAPGAGLSTEEENTGRAAEAIKKVQAEMADRQSKVREADAKLAEVMLSAHANSAESLAAIQQMQQDIVAALSDPNSNLDTPAGELQFLKFLREKAESAKQLVAEGKLTAADQAKMGLALAEFYEHGSGHHSGTSEPEAPAGQHDPSPLPGAAGDPAAYPPDLGPPPEMPGDLGLALPPDDYAPLTDALGSVAPLLSGLGNPLGGAIPGAGMDLGAVTRPISDAIAAAADRSSSANPTLDEDEPVEEDTDPVKEADETPSAEIPESSEPGDLDQPAAPEAVPGSVPDPSVDADPPPPPPSLQVDLRDGSQVSAADPSRAGATRALLAGTPYGEALRQNGLIAPPPGATLTNYLAPTQLQPGDYAMYPDKMVGVLGPDKFVGADGRIEPLTTLPPDGFLGFGRPTPAEGTVAPAGPVAAPPPAELASQQQPQQGAN